MTNFFPERRIHSAFGMANLLVSPNLSRPAELPTSRLADKFGSAGASPSQLFLSGYAAEALELLWRGRVSQTVTDAEAKAFRDMVVAALSRATIKPSPVGLGEHHLLDGGMVDGFALVHGGKVYQLFAFPKTHRL